MKGRIDDAERLAALLEGRVTDGERAALLAELARSDDGLEILGDAAAVTRELEEEDRAAGVLPIRAPRPGARPRLSARTGALLAAGIAGLLLAPLAWRAGRIPQGSYAMNLSRRVAVAGKGLPPGVGSAPRTSVRGADDGLSPGARAVRLGARQVDLHLARIAGDAAAAGAASRDAARLLHAVAGAGTAAAVYERAAAPAGEAVADRDLEAADANAERLAGTAAVRLGAWCEAARFAATRRDAAFFRDTRREVAELAATRGLPSGAGPALGDLRTVLDGGGPVDWAGLRTRLDVLLGAAGG
ncbi:MAG: hypothetical protein JWM27_2845 [Gemmatimonadetes bacterium]|nr:hypothetical protein [Gemmatimonadota bacterium]